MSATTMTTIEYLWGAVETLSIENQKWMLDRLMEKFATKSKEETAVATETQKPAKRKIIISPEVKRLSGIINTHGADLEALIEERVMEKAGML